MQRRWSRRLAVGLVAAFGSLGVASAAQAPALAPFGPVNEIRGELGLAPLRANAAADSVVRDLARRDFWDEAPLTLWFTPQCAVCRTSAGGVSPAALYRRRGGKGAIGFAIWRGDWTVRQNLAIFHEAAALVLDPRARTLSVARTPKGLAVVAVTVDADAAFTRPVRWPRGAIDPRRALWVDVLLPPGTHGKARLLERRAGGRVVVARPLAEERGIAGARLAAFGFNAQLAYERSYTLRAGRVVLELTSRRFPRSFARASWHFRSMSTADRRAFRAVFRAAPPLLRRIVAELDGSVAVVGGGIGCGADACMKRTKTGALVGVGKIVPFVVLHEFGHVVWNFGLDEPGRAAFVRAFLRTGRWHCTRAGCPRLEEIFADQLGYWALGGRPRGVLTYGDPQLLPRPRFERMLREQYAFRPPSNLGPLRD